MSTFDQVVRRSWEEHRLFSVLLELTYRCNLDCYFCYNDLSLRGRALSRQQYLDLLGDLADLGALNLVLTGGEPLAHPDFFDIGARARELGFVVRIKTNGHAVGRAVAERIRDEVAPYLVETSLHGAEPATHDRQTRVPGSFERLIENLGHMKAAGLRVKINSTLTAWNESEIEGMVEIAGRFEIPLQIDPEVTARDDGDQSPLSIRPSREAIARVMRIRSGAAADAARTQQSPAVTVQREGDDLVPPGAQKHCGAGASAIAIDPFGTVYPCVQWRRPVGNVHEHSIEEIWLGDTGLGEVREINAEVGETIRGLGAAGAAMGFCPGVAASATGDPRSLYSATATKLSIQGEAEEPAPRLPIVT